MTGLILSVITLITVFFIYILNRNEKVCEFRIHVSDLAYNYEIRHIGKNKVDGWDFSYNKLPSYSKMLYSFKPLTLESYFTQDVIEELLN